MYYSNVAERNAGERLDISLEIVLYKPLEEFIIYEVVADETAAGLLHVYLRGKIPKPFFTEISSTNCC